ncbi:GNAT family N-acetyltransferase [Mesorhizobium sp. B2-8-9]|uniref:GNAT family N-acetyltransferase n=1 Tax=Mesorhizobium sp. B2-8-9 TaxID=2589899 RepID=UPI001AED8EBA|nr:GNAT family N-acetyltransferase [Mesorhizobium sp. B2-8-9]
MTARPQDQKFAIRVLTPQLWPALEDLFGEKGATAGCWCMYWRIGAGYRKQPADRNRSAFKTVVQRGPPPGLLAFEREKAVGWCQITPRSALPHLGRVWRLRAGDDVPVWSLSCLYIRIGYRRRGIATALIEGAVALAFKSGAPAVEAYPIDAELSPSASSTGYVSTFERMGFVRVPSPTRERPILRLTRTKTERAFEASPSASPPPPARNR